jgi:hypothetical protein
MSEQEVLNLILSYVLKEFWHDFDFEEVNVAGSKRIEEGEAGQLFVNFGMLREIVRRLGI